jgi:hypothetical protein
MSKKLAVITVLVGLVAVMFAGCGGDDYTTGALQGYVWVDNANPNSVVVTPTNVAPAPNFIPAAGYTVEVAGQYYGVGGDGRFSAMVPLGHQNVVVRDTAGDPVFEFPVNIQAGTNTFPNSHNQGGS